MASKYSPIALFLKSVPENSSDVILSFDHISKILEFSLPASAFRHLAWWLFERNPKQPQKVCWQEVGWRVEKVDFSRGEVRFNRVTSTSNHNSSSVNSEPGEVQNLIFQSYSKPVHIEADLSLMIQNATWNPVFVIPKGTMLLKGRRGLYHDITLAAGNINDRFGCYSWGRQSEIYYCGSFAQDYVHGGFNSNFQARVHNYLQNHRIKPTGQKNTNLMVFEKINNALMKEDVLLCTFSFDRIAFAGATNSFSQYSEDPDLVHLVEQFLITFYRKIGQCPWNRT